MSARNYVDNAPSTTVSGAINSSVTSFAVASLAGYPASYPYTATLGLGTASAEVVLVTGAVGSTVTVTRNYNGLGAFSHPDGETFNHTANAIDYSEANGHINTSTGVHGVTGSVVGTGGTQTLTGKTLTSPVVNGGTQTGVALDATSTIGGISGTALAAARAAWTTYTPTFTNCTSPTGQFAYLQIGKTLFLRGVFTGGTVTATGAISLTLPPGLTAAGPSGQPQFVSATQAGSPSSWTIVGTGGTNAILSKTMTGGTTLGGGTVGLSTVLEVL